MYKKIMNLFVLTFIPFLLIAGSLSYRNYGVSMVEGKLELWLQAHVLVEADIASETISLPFPERFVNHLSPKALSNLVSVLKLSK